MTEENVELMRECCTKHLCLETGRIQKKNQTKVGEYKIEKV